MNWKDAARRIEIINRRILASKLLMEMTETDWAYVRMMPEKKQRTFRKQLNAALKGDLRFNFPVIEVDKLPE